MLRKTVILIFVFATLWLTKTTAQGLSAAAYELKYHRGVLFPHYKSFQYVMGDRIPTWEFNLKWQTMGEKPWHADKKFPEIGFGLFYSGLQKREFLGQAFGLQLLSQFRIFSSRSLSLNYRMTAGIVYVTKKYDLHTNPYNLVIGTHFNALIHTGFNLNYRFGNHVETALGLSLIHFSNGDIARPNAGLNQFSANAGISYRIKTFREPATEKLPFTRFGQMIFTLSGGGHQTEFRDNTRYPIASISADYQYYITRGSGFGIGTDLFYDKALEHYTVVDSLANNPRDKAWYFGLHAAYLFRTGNTQFELQTGPYLYGRTSLPERIYTRLILRQHLGAGLYAHIALKTYFSKADFVEWGAAWAIPFRKKAN